MLRQHWVVSGHQLNAKEHHIPEKLRTQRGDWGVQSQSADRVSESDSKCTQRGLWQLHPSLRVENGHDDWNLKDGNEHCTLSQQKVFEVYLTMLRTVASAVNMCKLLGDGAELASHLSCNNTLHKYKETEEEELHKSINALQNHTSILSLLFVLIPILAILEPAVMVALLEWEVNGPLLEAPKGLKMISTRVQSKGLQYLESE
ncbi:hypothetical protein EV702DRAFT_1051126 [Suillus placidus]|uniref:Uncharacterized protein n=1 Tax=Suillus placidus TaxID=48579 RepID=A0A9P6ZGH9_9AGAM|nr:hypothetical protein EV702DRAFT_1051126 [Suillus placidus]